MVRIHPDPPTPARQHPHGAIAQLGERLLCKQEVTGSIPVGSTTRGRGADRFRQEAVISIAATGCVISASSVASKEHRLFFNNLE
jgi:hypothetical protein